MPDSQHGGLECQQFARTLQGEPFMPGSQRRHGKEEFEGPRNGHATQRLEGITSDHRAVPRIEKSEMAWSVSRRGKHFDGADAIAFVQQACRLRRADGIATAQGDLRLRGVQALIAGQEPRVSLADRNLRLRQRLMERIQRANRSRPTGAASSACAARSPV